MSSGKWRPFSIGINGLQWHTLAITSVYQCDINNVYHQNLNHQQRQKQKLVYTECVCTIHYMQLISRFISFLNNKMIKDKKILPTRSKTTSNSIVNVISAKDTGPRL